MKVLSLVVVLALFCWSGQATFNLSLDPPGPLTCGTNLCEHPETDCTLTTGLNCENANDDDGCGGSGGHAMYSDFSASRPGGFGEDRWNFEVHNGATTGRLEFYGNNAGDRGRLYGSLVGIHQQTDQWDLDVEFVKVTRTANMAVKNELYQSCSLANTNQLAANWQFYALALDRPSVLVGKGKNVGCNITLILDRSNMYHLQVGLGGSEKNARFGITAWISYASFSYDDALWAPNDVNRPRFNFRLTDRMKDGDLNINAYCPCQCDNPPPPTPVCGNHIVENGEQCDGGECCQKNCTYVPSTKICRASVAECDQNEFCTGSSSTCPPDSFHPNTLPCEETVGFCDVRLQNVCPGDDGYCHGPPSISIDQGFTSWESFNVISFNNYIVNSGDVEGRLAVKNNFNVAAGFSIGAKTDTTPGGHDIFVPVALIVGHNSSWPIGGSIFPDGKGVPTLSYEEGAFVGDSFSDWPPYLKLRVIGSSTVIGDKDAEFEAARTFYLNLQNRFSSGTDNVVVTNQYGGLFFKCDDSAATFYYASVQGSDLSAATWYNLDNCNIQASYVINVRGSGDVTLQGGRFPTIIERVVYNIIGSGRTINIQTEVGGNILAPNNIYTQINGVTKGLVIVGDVTAVVQNNLPNCAKFDPVVISARTRARIEGHSPSRDTTTDGDLIPVYTFGSFALGDEITIGGSETVTFTKGVVDTDGNLYLQVDPVITGSYGADTVISASIQDPGNAVRPEVNAEPYTPHSSDASSVVFSAALVALLALFTF